MIVPIAAPLRIRRLILMSRANPSGGSAFWLRPWLCCGAVWRIGGLAARQLEGSSGSARISDPGSPAGKTNGTPRSKPASASRAHWAALIRRNCGGRRSSRCGPGELVELAVHRAGADLGTTTPVPVRSAPQSSLKHP